MKNKTLNKAHAAICRSVLFFCLVFITSNVVGQEKYLNTDTKITLESADAINSKNLESSPIFYENGIVFVYAKEKSKLIDLKIGLPFFELMYAPLGPDGTPRKAVSFSSNIRSKFHEGQAAFSNDFSQMFFTRSNAYRGKGVEDSDRQVNLNIFSATKGLEDWEDITLLPICNDQWSVCHPAIAQDGSFMIFSSDMPGGEGGMDLYMIDVTDGAYGIPTNLGPEVNTSENEVFPTLQKNDILFFSSNGHKSKGGLDIFSAKKMNEKYVQVAPLPAPINSRKDDLGLVFDASGQFGFLASARKESRGKDDIFMVQCADDFFEIASEIPEVVTEAEDHIPTPPSAPTPPMETETLPETLAVAKKNCLVVTGKIKSYIAQALLDQARITLTSRCGEAPMQILSDNNGLYDACLSPECYYDVRIEKEGFETETFNFKPDPNNNPIWHIFLKKKENTLAAEPKVFKEEKDSKESEETIFNTTELSAGKVIVLDNIYYDFNKSAIQRGAAKELDELVKIMKEYPSMEIDLFAHTDSRGKPMYNLELSERRGYAAKDYMVARGVAGRRITIIPMGEQDIRNHCKEGVECNDKEHQYNRRTEVKVTKVDANIKFQ